MFIYDEIFRMNAFSDNNIGRYDTILYNSAGFDNTSSSDDGIFNCSFDQAPLETTEEVTLLPSKY